MGRRRGYKMTDAEMMKCKYSESCPLRACKGRGAQMALSRASWKECTTCGHQWEFRGGGNKIITREQKDELVGRRLGGRGSGEAEERRAVARRREQYRQEMSEMNKTAKTAKGVGQKRAKAKAKAKAKKAARNTAARKPLGKTLYDFIVGHPNASDEVASAAMTKDFPDRRVGPKDVAWYRSLWSRGVKLPKGAAKALPKSKAAKKPVAKRKK